MAIRTDRLALLSSRPAFAPLVPGPVETAAALALTLAAALVAAAVARALSDSLARLA